MATAQDFQEIFLARNSSQEVCAVVRNYSSACDKVHDLYPFGEATDMPGWATLILAACLVCGEAKLEQYQRVNDILHGRTRTKPTQHSSSTTTPSTNPEEVVVGDMFGWEPGEDESAFKLKVGKTINVFPRYGSLTLTMKIFPSQFNDGWLFREKTFEIFEKDSYWAKRGRGTNNDDGFDDHFLIDFCDTSKDLYAAYFDHFEVEGAPEAHKAFASFLSPKSKAQTLGIFPTYLTNDEEYSFVLVRLFRRRERALLDGDLRLDKKFIEAASKIRIGSSESAHQFMDQFGTHVIVEYELGDVIYQVFVFGQRTYDELKTTFALSYDESKTNATDPKRSLDEQMNIRDYFTPYFAVHVGEVNMASGNKDFENIRGKLKKRYFMFNFYQSIFQILNNKEISEDLLEVKGEVITGMRLKKITKALSPTPERYWLSMILDNTLSLYYVTM